ncbi:hypothetical protein E2320_006590 [Naja naja]|nr:hypothetical protein E2320_006590 [Naja naja]
MAIEASGFGSPLDSLAFICLRYLLQFLSSGSWRGFPEPDKNHSLMTSGGKKMDNRQQSMEQEKEFFWPSPEETLISSVFKNWCLANPSGWGEWDCRGHNPFPAPGPPPGSGVKMAGYLGHRSLTSSVLFKGPAASVRFALRYLLANCVSVLPSTLCVACSITHSNNGRHQSMKKQHKEHQEAWILRISEI